MKLSVLAARQSEGSLKKDFPEDDSSQKQASGQ